VPGERNELRYAPRGVVAVIAPWNFPIAIPCGMVAAGLATGNAVVLKPAEQSPACGHAVVRALRESGVPADALALLPGEGEAGAALVAHRDVHTIAFTGSGPVGLSILETAAKARAQAPQARGRRDGRQELRAGRLDADLDDAVPAIVQSAFLYAGQKCSAASRVLVHEAIADAFLERVAGAVEVLQVGQAETFGIDVPPVIEREAQERVQRYRELSRSGGRIAAEQLDGVPGHGGSCPRPWPPTCPPTRPCSRGDLRPAAGRRARQGPDAAMDRVDELPFALTGGLFCRNPHTVERVVRRTPVGNLYVNRSITGAMVGASRSAATGCRGPGRRPAALTTCCTSWSRTW
jgi:RHH-type proline utilization regulon transcriptional repressor/proline dehydrogenase/delta 1-pyrroline-5-carboxylate dehydrogenase